MAELVGRAIRETRKFYRYSLRELARRAGISAAQLSRIEAEEVKQPSMETLGAIARALDRNPRHLWVVSGHIGGGDARKLLGEAFAEDSELVDQWGGRKADVRKARALLRRKAAGDEELRALAAEVFKTWQTEETLWWDAYLEPLVRAGSQDLKDLIQEYELLSPERKRKVQTYVRDQAELNLLETRRAMGEDV